MRATIFTFVRYSKNSMVASIRIARWLSEKMAVPVYDQTNIHDIKNKSDDLLIIVNGAYGFCPCLAELAVLIKAARRIVWVQNDFTIVPPKIESAGVSPFRAAFRERHEAGKPHMDFWTTCEDWQGFTPGSRYVNWNALTFDQKYDPKHIAEKREMSERNIKSLLYYGSYRAASGKSSRVKYFDRYFKDPQVSTVISSPAKQFAENYKSEKIEYWDSMKENFYGLLGGFGLGLYIEDRLSHERFHSPANRFYEMLSAGLPMVFQPEAESMMARAGYPIGSFIANSARSIPALMEKREEIGEEQRRRWISGDPGKFRRTLVQQFEGALQTQMGLLK